MNEFTIEEGEVIEDPTCSGNGGEDGGAIALAQLSDVDISGVTNGQVLMYDAGSQKWKPGALDTLKEIADQLANDESAVAALTTTMAGKESSSNKVTTLASANNTTFPTTQAVATGLANKANTDDLAPVATAGSFASLSGKPVFVALSSLPSDLSGYPDGSRIIITG